MVSRKRGDAPALDRRPLIIAHRGASGLAPENTLAAFRLAIELGVDGIEFDVRMSADGHPVVIHDLTLDRTTNASGPVEALTVAQLSRLDAGLWFDRRLINRARRKPNAAGFGRYSGERVPTLEAVLGVIGPAGLKRVYIEVKSKEASRSDLVLAVLDLIRKFGLEESTTILSFDHEAVRKVKLSRPHIRTAVNFPTPDRLLPTVSHIAEAAGAAGADEAALHFGLANRRTVDKLHGRGLSVSAWTANSKLVFRRLISGGVDGIMTNFPDRLGKTLGVPTSSSR